MINFTKSFLIAVLFFNMLFTAGFAQKTKDPVILTVGNEKITKQEFLTVYQKNNVQGEVLDKKSLEEYLDLYINFKLKVKEAEAQGLDTIASFKAELNGYRQQLAKPYFIDEELNTKILQQSYERKKEDLRVSHILIRVDANAKPEDTLAAWTKISDIRQRIVKGEDFSEVAYETSEDPSARDMEGNALRPARKGNKGDVGYFSVFDMVYPFEEAAFNTPVGKVSEIVRTEFGYHLLIVKNRRPSLGKVQVAHLFLMMPKDSKHEDSVRLQTRIDSIYQAVQSGSKFEELVSKFSDDKGTAANGGVLPWFGSNRMVPEFVDAVYELKNPGDLSKPILTSYGWHIIKMIEHKPVGTYDESKEELKQKLAKDPRSNKSRESIITKIKAKAKFSENLKNLEPIEALLDSSIYQRKWDAFKAQNLNKTIFNLEDKKYTQKDFADYIAKNQRIGTTETVKHFVEATYKKYVEDMVIEYEDKNLENHHPEFKALMKEYRDGILLFDLTDKMVWTKAIKDTVGLKDFYLKNQNSYMWDNRVDATLYTFKDGKEISKGIELINKGTSDEEILKVINQDTLNILTIDKRKFSKGDNEFVDAIAWEPGVKKPVADKDGNSVLIVMHQLIKPEVKTLNEAKGLITADYQNFLEKEWIQQLRGKYPVVVNREVLDSIQ